MIRFKADEVSQDVRDNSSANSHDVAAGIGAVQRAQSRGYVLARMGWGEAREAEQVEGRVNGLDRVLARIPPPVPGTLRIARDVQSGW